MQPLELAEAQMTAMNTAAALEGDCDYPVDEDLV
jgi:hypothetical protein